MRLIRRARAEVALALAALLVASCSEEETSQRFDAGQSDAGAESPDASEAPPSEDVEVEILRPITLHDDVVVVPEDVAVRMRVEEDGLVVDPIDNAWAEGLAPGSVVVGGVGDGFMRRFLHLEEVADSAPQKGIGKLYRLATKLASLLDVILDGEFRASARPSVAVQTDLQLVNHPEVGVALTSSYGIGSELSAYVNLVKGTLVESRLGVKLIPSIQASASVRVASKYTKTEKVELLDATVWRGLTPGLPIPIVLSLRTKLSLTGSVSAAAKWNGQFGARCSSVEGGSFVFANGAWSFESDQSPTTCTATATASGVSADATVSLGLEPRAALVINGLAGPFVQVSDTIVAKATLCPGPSRWSAERTKELVVGIEAPIFGEAAKLTAAPLAIRTLVGDGTWETPLCESLDEAIQRMRTTRAAFCSVASSCYPNPYENCYFPTASDQGVSYPLNPVGDNLACYEAVAEGHLRELLEEFDCEDVAWKEFAACLSSCPSPAGANACHNQHFAREEPCYQALLPVYGATPECR